MEEKELQELEQALRAATSEMVLGDAGAVNALRDAAEAALPALLADLREARRLLGEAKQALMDFLNDPQEAARAREVVKQLDAVLAPLAIGGDA